MERGEKEKETNIDASLLMTDALMMTDGVKARMARARETEADMEVDMPTTSHPKEWALSQGSSTRSSAQMPRRIRTNTASILLLTLATNGNAASSIASRKATESRSGGPSSQTKNSATGGARPPNPNQPAPGNNPYSMHY